MTHPVDAEVLSHFVDPSRVAEIIVTAAGTQQRSRGSGYLINGLLVLTATHVVADGHNITLRFNPDSDQEWETSVTEIASAGEVTVLRLRDPHRDLGPVTTPLGRFAERAAVVRVHALGYPRFKLRSSAVADDSGTVSAVYRDLHHAVGWCAVLSNLRGRSLEVTVEPPGSDADERSPWEGMSGSALWADGCIVGVVTAHHQQEGLNRITACRLDHEWRMDGPGGRALSSMLAGLTPSDLMTIPAVSADELILSAYAEQVFDIAPAEGLRHRDDEMAQLAEFCAGAEPYCWWQGAPWSGKSALLASFAVSPPEGVDIVSFFVTGRLSGQADSDAFTDALIDQLSALRGVPPVALASPHARDARRRWLLREAADLALRKGRRLALVIDGLDEDVSPRLGKPSIASLLPKRDVRGLVVIVASRHHPALPLDVAADHPLRICPIRELAPSRHAQNIQDQASWELNQLLNGDATGRDLVGLISASGGGLTSDDLAEISGAPPFVISEVVEGASGRSLESRPGRLGARRPRRVYMFAHDTLRETVGERLGDTLLSGYRSRIHAWASTYEQRDWPSDTPSFLLTGYAQLVEREGDIDRLTGLAVDTRRQLRLLAETGSDSAALSAIRSAQGTITRGDKPGLVPLARLALHRLTLVERNNRLPSNLPLVLAKLGDPQRADELARMMGGQERMGLALADIVSFFAENRDRERAEVLARLIEDDEIRAQSLGRLVRAALRAGHIDDAIRLVAGVTYGEIAGSLCADIADALKMTDAPGALDRFLDQITGLLAREDARATLSVRLAREGHTDRAEAILGSIENPYIRAQSAIALFAGRLAGSEEADAEPMVAIILDQLSAVPSSTQRAELVSDLISELADAGRIGIAQRLHGTLQDQYWHSISAIDIVKATARSGDVDAADALCGRMSDPYLRSRTASELLGVMAESNAVPGVVDRYAVNAISAARAIADAEEREQAQSELAVTLGRLGRDLDALALCAEIRSTEWCAETFLVLGQLGTDAPGRAAAGQLLDKVADLCGSAVDSDWREDILQRLACAFAELSNPDKASSVIDMIRDPGHRSYAMAAAANIAVDRHEPDLAAHFVKLAESSAQMSSEPNRQVLADLIDSLARVENYDQACTLAELVVHSEERIDALLVIAERGRHAQAGTGVRRALTRAVVLCGDLDIDLDRARGYAAVSAAGSRSDCPDVAQGALDEALSALGRHRGRCTDVDLLAAIGGAAGLAGNIDLSWVYFRSAQAAANLISETDARCATLVDLIRRFLAHGGRADRALVLTESLDDPFWLMQALTSLAVNEGYGTGSPPLAGLDGVLDILRGIPDRDRRAQAMADLAVCRAAAGSIHDAAELLTEIEDEYWFTLGLTNVVGETFERGGLEFADVLIERIEDPYRRFEVLIEWALLAVGKGMTAEAVTLVSRAEQFVPLITDPDRRLEALMHFATVLTASGQTDRVAAAIAEAFGEAERYIEVDRGSQTACALARVAARAGLMPVAQDIVGAIRNEYWRSRAAAGIAGWWAGAGRAPRDRDAVRSLMATCLLGDGWRVALPQLGDIDPEILVALYEELHVISG